MQKDSLSVSDDIKSRTVFRDGLFKDKVVLVSGAGTGLGKAAAEQFPRLGASLAICGRNGERLQAVAAELRKLGTRVLARPMTTGIRRPFPTRWTRHGGKSAVLTLLVNNAAGQFASPALEIKPKAGLRSSTPTSTARGT